MKKFIGNDYGYWEQTSRGLEWRNVDYDPTALGEISDFQTRKDLIEALSEIEKKDHPLIIAGIALAVFGIALWLLTR